MTKLSKMDRDDLQILLGQHDTLVAIEARIGKRGILIGVSLTNTYKDSDFESVTISDGIAKQAVKQMREAVEKKLAEYGVQVTA